MIYLPSFSNTDQLLECTYAFGRDLEREETHKSRFGTGAHEIFAGLMRGHFTGKNSFVPGEVPPDAVVRGNTAAKVFLEWWNALDPLKDSPDDLSKAWIEAPFVMNLSNATRGEFLRHIKTIACPPADPETHEYAIPNRAWFHFPGALDLGILRSRRLFVFDYKTGVDTPTPRSSGQLLSQATALYCFNAWSEGFDPSAPVTIGFVHAPEDGDPVVLTDEVSPAELWDHARALRRALHRIGNGELRPWDAARDGHTKRNWCTICDARQDCPVGARDLVVAAADALHVKVIQGGEVVLAGTEPGQIISRQRLGQIIKQRSAMDKLSRELGSLLQADIEANGPAEYDGKVYTVETTEPFDNLSIASVKRALGVVKAEKEIERLRKLGCVEKTTRTRIQPRNA